MKITSIIIAGVLLVGCNSVKKGSPPAGYSKPLVFNSQFKYLVPPDSIYYNGNRDFLQIKIVTTLRNEVYLNKIKIKSIKATHIYDCRKENKYTEKPDGFFEDEYATGLPAIPYTETTSVWKIANNNSLDQIVWNKLCGLSNNLEKRPDILVSLINKEAPVEVDEFSTLIGADNDNGKLVVKYNIKGVSEKEFHNKLRAYYRGKQISTYCTDFKENLKLSIPRSIVYDYYIKNDKIYSSEIYDYECQKH